MRSVLFQEEESDTASSSSDSSLSHSSEGRDRVAPTLVSENSGGRPSSDATYHLPWKAPPQKNLPPLPSFRPLRSPLPSLELLNPAPDSKLRRSGVTAATFNLIATIIGGSILSMPLSLAKSGVVLWTGMMVFAALITDFSLYLFCSCARRTGATSYGEVVRHAFGPGLEVAVNGMIFLYLFMVLVAHMILVKGIWAPVVMTFLSDVWQWKAPPEPMRAFSNLILLGATVLAVPLFLRRDLFGLRHSCYVSFASIFVLCVAMSYRAYQRNTADSALFHNEILYVTPNLTDALFAYPIVAQSYVSSFNIVQVHCALVNPTRKRVKKVISSSVLFAFLVMFFFSFGGYLYAFNDTKGNILLNFDPHDKIVFLGRIGCGICTLLAMPMSLLPCRDAILALPVKFAQWREWRAAGKREMTSGDVYSAAPAPLLNQLNLARVGNGCQLDEEACPLVGGPPPRSTAPAAIPSYAATGASAAANPAKLVSSLSRDCIQDAAHRDKIRHYLATLAILVFCYVCAILAPGVAIVWSLCGSSMGFLVQFILPSACYIKLRAVSRRGGGVYTRLAWGLLLLSVVSAAACTIQTFWRMFFFVGAA